MTARGVYGMRFSMILMIKTGVLLIALPRSPQGGSSGWREICIASLSATSANLPWQLIATIFSTEDDDDDDR